MPDWETEILCPKCGTGYSVIGTAYFCPCCGYNNVKTALIESLTSIEKMVDSIDDMERLFRAKYGENYAKDASRKLLEDSLSNIVSAFQKYAELLYSQISTEKARVNDFQIIDKRSKLFMDACGKDYSSWLNASELDRVNLLFQKRHILEHNAGIVDDMYLQKSGDNSYVTGQRMIIKKSEIYELINLIKKLCKGLSQECEVED